MKKTLYTLCVWIAWLVCLPGNLQGAPVLEDSLDQTGNLQIGWSTVDITPTKPVLLRGQLYARFSEGVLDPLSATALVVSSGATHVVLVSCDVVSIPDGVRDGVRKLVLAKVPELDPTDITLGATHTHTAPMMSTSNPDDLYGVPFAWLTGAQDATTPGEYQAFIIEQVANAVVRAWQSRKPGGVSYGLSKAVLGHNRLQAALNGKSLMYGNTARPEFSHIEGYEDHSLNLLYTWDRSGELTGVLINAAVPAQVSEGLYQVSADFWAQTRELLRAEVKADLFILPQVSAAGDQSPHVMWDRKAEERMQKLMGFEQDGTGRGSMGQRKQIARSITDGVKAILPYMKESIEWDPVLAQKLERVPLSRRLLGQSDLEEADRSAAVWKMKYDSMYNDFFLHPEKRNKKHWYKDITQANSRANRGRSVRARYNAEKKSSTLAVELKVIRIGNMAIATNPFELYLDYGIQIKVKSPAVQTFVAQLTGSGTYLPTRRSIIGGAYGAVPASTIFGPEGGAELVAKTVDILYGLWGQDNPYVAP